MDLTSTHYRESCVSATSESNGAERPSLQQQVGQLMVAVHAIPPELASHHVSQMTQDELADRFRQYTGTELSVAGPKPASAGRKKGTF